MLLLLNTDTFQMHTTNINWVKTIHTQSAFCSVFWQYSLTVPMEKSPNVSRHIRGWGSWDPLVPQTSSFLLLLPCLLPAFILTTLLPPQNLSIIPGVKPMLSPTVDINLSLNYNDALVLAPSAFSDLAVGSSQCHGWQYFLNSLLFENWAVGSISQGT